MMAQYGTKMIAFHHSVEDLMLTVTPRESIDEMYFFLITVEVKCYSFLANCKGVITKLTCSS
jgi:hypothetical protein